MKRKLLLKQILNEQKKTNELLQVIVSNKEQLAAVIHDPSKLNLVQGNIVGDELGRVILTV